MLHYIVLWHQTQPEYDDPNSDILANCASAHEKPFRDVIAPVSVPEIAYMAIDVAFAVCYFLTDVSV